MNGLPYYKAYPRDFIEGTVGMSFEIKGAYRILLDVIYMRGGKLPDDARYIAGILGCSVRTWNKYRAALLDAGKIVMADGMISNFRADKELKSLSSFQAKQRENRSRPNKNRGLDSPAFDHTEPDTEPDTKKKKEDDAANAASPSSRYAFAANTIKLTKEHLEQWRKNCPSIRLEAELMAMDDWAGTKGKNWFNAVRGLLAKKEREAFERIQMRKLEISTPRPPTRQHIDGRI